MKFKSILFNSAACFGIVLLSSCASYDTDLKVDYYDRARVEKMSDSDITSQSIDINQMKKEKKLGIGVLVKVSDQTQARCKLPDSVGLTETGWELAKNFLDQTKAYQVYVLPRDTKPSELMTGSDFKGPKYSFLIEMNIVLTSEIEETLDQDEALYKTTIDWKLIDNRTKANGGKLEAPTIKESLVCRAMTTRKLKITSVRGSRDRMGGSEIRNAQNAYFNTLANAMFQFKSQLSNRIPYGGKISSMRLLDGKVRMTMSGGRETGIVQKMQMLIINEEGDQVAVATATGGSSGKMTLNVWRWLSPSLKKSILAVAGDKKKSEAWLEEEGNMLYAVCLGALPPSKDEISNFNDKK